MDSSCNRKCAVVGFCFLFASIGASLTDYSACFILSGIFIVIAGVLGCIPIKQREKIGLALFSMGVAFGLYGLFLFTVYQPIMSLDLAVDTEIQGSVIEQSYAGGDRGSYIINAEISGQKLKLLVRGEDISAQQGDKVSFLGRLAEIKSDAEFDAKYHYFSKGVFVFANAVSEIELTKSEFRTPGFYIDSYSAMMKDKIQTLLPNDYGAFLSGIFLGDRTNMSPELKSAVQRTGIGHLTAVSGFHLAIMAHFFAAIIKKLKIRNRFLRFSLFAVVIFTLMLFFNMTISVIRAGIVMFVYYSAELFFRRGDSLNSLGMSILIVLIPAPYACLDIGFLLSLAGTFGIGTAAPYVVKIFGLSSLNQADGDSTKLKTGKIIGRLFLVSTCAFLCTVPLTVVFFGGISLVCVVMCVIIQPFFYLCFLLMAAFVLSGGYITVFLLAAGVMAKIMVWLIELFDFKYCFLPLPYDFVLPWALASVVFITACIIVFKSKTGARVCKAVLLSFCMLLFMAVYSEYKNYTQTHLYIYSDGEEGALFLRERDVLAVIVTNDRAKTHSKIKEYIKNHYLDEVTFLCFINNSQTSAVLPSQFTVFSNEIEGFRYDIGGKFEFSEDEGEYILTVGDIKIAISDINNLSGNADISVISRYKQQNPTNVNGQKVYLNRRMKAVEDDEINAYFDKVEYIFEKGQS